MYQGFLKFVQNDYWKKSFFWLAAQLSMLWIIIGLHNNDLVWEDLECIVKVATANCGQLIASDLSIFSS